MRFEWRNNTSQLGYPRKCLRGNLEIGIYVYFHVEKDFLAGRNNTSQPGNPRECQRCNLEIYFYVNIHVENTFWVTK